MATKKRARGRPKATRARLSTKDRILLAAEGLFAQRGFKDVTLQDVAGELGVNAALITYYFGSKKELIRLAVRKVTADAAKNFALPAHTPDGAVSPAQYLTRVLEAFIDFSEKNEVNFRFQSWVIAEQGDFLRDTIEEQVSPMIALFASLIDQARPGLSPVEREARAAMVCTAADQYARVRWAFLKNLKLDSHPDTFLKEFGRFICQDLVQAVLK